MTPYVEEMLKQMQDLLVVNSPDNGISHSLSDSDQLFIYETASTLIVASTIEPEVRTMNSYALVQLHSFLYNHLQSM